MSYRLRLRTEQELLREALRKGEVEGLIWECRMLRPVRPSGSGDMTDEHVDAVPRGCPAASAS